MVFSSPSKQEYSQPFLICRLIIINASIELSHREFTTLRGMLLQRQVCHVQKTLLVKVEPIVEHARVIFHSAAGAVVEDINNGMRPLW
jgi:hypothetical protein